MDQWDLGRVSAGTERLRKEVPMPDRRGKKKYQGGKLRTATKTQVGLSELLQLFLRPLPQQCFDFRTAAAPANS